MRLLQGSGRFDGAGYAIFIFAPVSLLFFAAVAKETLGDWLPGTGDASMATARHETGTRALAAGQWRNVLLPHDALGAGPARKSSHE